MSDGPPPAKKARFHSGSGHGNFKKMNKKQAKAAKAAANGVVTGNSDEVLQYAVLDLIGRDKVAALEVEGKDTQSPFQHLQEVEVNIIALGAHGDGLGWSTEYKDWLVAVPFCVPGERVLARIYRSARLISHADLVRIISQPDASGSTMRDDSLVGCKYFNQCGGCQYQHIPYPTQLQHKQKVVQDAFRNFSKLDPSLLPEARPTIPSPNQYKYRTKLTPHFEAPPAKLSLEEKQSRLAIGFEVKGRKKILDIEECPISTDTINKQYTVERKNVFDTIDKYKRGSTMLLRHSLPPTISAAGESTPSSEDSICITKHNQVVRERVAGKDFEFNAGSFFQNNNGILEELVSYVKSELSPSAPAAANAEQKQYLVDTYCGSGLFAISLADRFEQVSGVEISQDSVKWAIHNAKLNGVDNATFITGSAERIFEGITFPSAQTTILIDPPRKGCDDAFLKQLVAFGPARVLYVSCNVHTQARDVGFLVKEGGYNIESIRGADLFPQTYHVEGVCVLSK